MGELIQIERVASERDFRSAVSLAHARLCTGRDGVEVEGRETWTMALVRVTCSILALHGYGRPRGEPPSSWVDFVRRVAREPSTAPDGRVQRLGLRVALGSFPRGDV